MGKLQDKVAIVTGAARGLGRAYALRLAALGCKVAACDINLKSHEEFEQEAGQGSVVDEVVASGATAVGFEFDVSDRASVDAMVAEVNSAWGRVDVLVANAGGGRGSLAETKASIVSPELLELVTKINLFGTVHCCSSVAPIMKEQRSGKIITVSSHAGQVAGLGGGYAHYGANKAAIAHYTRYLAQELGRFGINVNCISPGMISTARVMKLVEGKDDGVMKEIALRRYGTPEDCANVIEFLATDLSCYVTGALIPIDGGWNRAG